MSFSAEPGLEGMRASVAAACGLESAGLVVAPGLVPPQHVRSSWIRDRTCVSCIGRRILYH